MRIPLATGVAFAVFISGSGAFASSSTPLPGGANQRSSVEGCMHQTLFDGFWRFKVTSVNLVKEFSYTDTKAWAVAIEIRNARTTDTTPALVGVGQPQLVLADGTVLDMDTDSGIAYGRQVSYANLPPGGSAHGTLYFRPDTNTSKPDKLLLAVSPRNPVYHTLWGYPVKDPSFRVHLNCTK